MFWNVLTTDERSQHCDFLFISGEKNPQLSVQNNNDKKNNLTKYVLLVLTKF